MKIGKTSRSVDEALGLVPQPPEHAALGELDRIRGEPELLGQLKYGPVASAFSRT
jgi:hypothetical protein